MLLGMILIVLSLSSDVFSHNYKDVFVLQIATIPIDAFLESTSFLIRIS